VELLQMMAAFVEPQPGGSLVLVQQSRHLGPGVLLVPLQPCCVLQVQEAMEPAPLSQKVAAPHSVGAAWNPVPN